MKLPLGWSLKSYENVTSTMDEARLHLQDKNIIWTKTQSQGRGRHQRVWVSERGNLFCSLIIRPVISQERWPELAFVSALAVGETIEIFLQDSSSLGYKWPNDILLNGQKVGGILLETEGNFMIIGIGLNLISYPEETSYPTAYLKKFSSLNLTVESILPLLVARFQDIFTSWQQNGFQELRARWLQRAHHLGREIRLKSRNPNDKSEIIGNFQGLKEDGSLLLKLPDGTMKSYSTGDVFFA